MKIFRALLNIRHLREAVLLSLLLFLAGAGCSPGVTGPAKSAAPQTAPHQAEVLWDAWGVPHIFASDQPNLFYAFGQAQMQGHGDLILRSYGQARGKAAEYWGAAYLDEDRWVQMNDIPARARTWYEAQSPAMRHSLDAFAAGINDYARQHPDRLAADVQAVLPVDATDVLAHIQHTIHFTFLASPITIRGQIQGSLAGVTAPTGGSMAWAIAPKRTRDGHALLLINPHVDWGGSLLWFEAQLTAPGVDAYGVSFLGFPTMAMGFNNDLGWAHTVNPLDAYDLYSLTVRDGGYVWEGSVRPFDTETRVLKVKQADGTLKDETLQILRSVHGPVVWKGGDKAVALRVAGLDQAGLVEQYWDMSRARDLQGFEAALRRLQSPMFSVIYADRQGHVLHFFGGQIPVRAKGDWAFWAGLVPGDTAETLWTKTHPYEDLPRVLDPATGWLQNANDPPWMTTFPPVLDPAKFPAYMAPRGLELRPENAIKLLRANEHISFDDLVTYKHSTHCELADRWLDDLVKAARESGDATALRAADTLEKWDRKLDADSRGAFLFQAWVIQMVRRRPPTRPTNYAEVWQESDPLATPRGLLAPAEAAKILIDTAQQVEKAFGRLDVSWGEANRIRLGDIDLPGNGGPSYMGSLRTLNFLPAKDGKFETRGGETFIAAVEFSDPLRAEAVLAYGNASQTGSKHKGDQLELLSRKQLRPVWRVRPEIEQHLESRETFSYVPLNRP